MAKKNFTDFIEGGVKQDNSSSGNKSFIDYTFAPTRNTDVTNASGYETFKGDSQYDQGLVHGYNQAQVRAYNQPWTHEFGNALGQIALNTIPTVIGNVASMLDFEDYFNQDNEVGNAITRSMEEWKQNITGNVLPIYEQEPGKSLNLGSSEWWNKAFGDIGTSALGFAGTGMLTGAAFNSLGKVLSMSQRLAQYGEQGKLAAQTLTAIGLNQAESIPIAMNVYDDIYNQGINQGLTEAEAKQKAADAGAYSINMNRANALLNLTSSGMFLKNPAITRKLVDQVALKNTLKTLGIEGLQEATEEVINLGAEATAKEYGKASLQGKDYDSATEDFLNAVLTKEGLESAFLGALGGMAQTGTSIASKAIQGDYKAQQEQYLKQQVYLAQLDAAQTANGGLTSNRFLNNVSRTSDYSKQYQEAIDNNDLAGAELIANKSLNDQAFEAYSLGTTEKLEDAYNNINKLTTEQALQKGYDVNTDSPFYYKKRATEALKTIKQNEGLYTSLANQYGFDENFTRTIFDNRTQASYNIGKVQELTDKLTKLQTQLDSEVRATGLDLETNESEIKNLPSYLELNTTQKQINSLKKNINNLRDEYRELTSPEAVKIAKERTKEKVENIKTAPIQTVSKSVEIPLQDSVKETIPDALYETFQDDKSVPQEVLNSIREKIVSKTPLSVRENEIALGTPELIKTVSENQPLFDIEGNLTPEIKETPTETTINKTEPIKVVKDNILGVTKEGKKSKKQKLTTPLTSVVTSKMTPSPLEINEKTDGSKFLERSTPSPKMEKTYSKFKKGRKIINTPSKGLVSIRFVLNQEYFDDNKTFRWSPKSLPINIEVKDSEGKWHPFTNLPAQETLGANPALREHLWNIMVVNPVDKGPRQDIQFTNKETKLTTLSNKIFEINRTKDGGKRYSLKDLLRNNSLSIYQGEGVNDNIPVLYIVENGISSGYKDGKKLFSSSNSSIEDGVYFGLVQPNNTIVPERLDVRGNYNELKDQIRNGSIDLKNLKTDIFESEPTTVTGFSFDTTFDGLGGQTIIGKEGRDVAKIGTGNEVNPINLETELQWISTHLPADIPVNIVEDIQVIGSHGGEQAWGLFKDAAIYLSEKAGEGTGYHEAFHAVFRLMLDDTKIENILSEARNKYSSLKKATDLEVEEFLADKFSEYVINNQETNSEGGIKELFNRLWDWIKSFVNNSEIDRLFQNIERKKFFNPAIQRATNKFTASIINQEGFSYPVYKKLVPGLTLDQEQRRFNNIHYLYTQSILEDDLTKHPDNTDSVNTIYNEMNSVEKLEFYQKAFDKLQDVAKGLPENSLTQLQILSDNFDLFVSEHEGYMQSFNEGILSPDIHQYMSELYEYVQDENGNLTEATDELGLPIYGDFDSNFNLIYEAIKDITDINSVIEKLDILKDTYPQLNKVVKDLIADNSRLNKEAFLESFSGNSGKIQASSYNPMSAIETPYKEYKDMAFKAQGNIELSGLENGDPIKLKFFKEASEKLVNVFNKAGYNVVVKTDQNLDTRGKIGIDNVSKTAIVTLGKDANYETLTEEFSHLYLASLGYDSSLMREGIRIAKKYRPELWKRIQEVYNDSPLAVQEEELIVKLMAEEGVKILTSPEPSPLKYWINKLIRAISEFLGIPVNSARYLFEDMLDGKIGNRRLSNKDIRYDKNLEIGEDNKELSTLSKALKEYKASLERRIGAISKTTGTSSLKQDKLRSLKGLRYSLSKLNEEEQFAKILYFASKDLDSLMDEFKNYSDKLGTDEYAQFVHQTKVYLDSFKILSKPTDLYEGEKLQYVVNSVNLKINKLGNLISKGTEEQIKSLIDEFSSNPDLIKLENVKKLIEGTVDISTFQYQFGALASSEDPLLALADKRLKLQKRKTYDFTLALREDMVRLRDNLYKSTGSYTQEFMNQKDENGKETGRIVDRISYAYDKSKREVMNGLTDKNGKLLEYIENPQSEEDLIHNVNVANKYLAVDKFFDADNGDNHVFANEFIEDRNAFETPTIVNGKVVGWEVKPEFIEEVVENPDGTTETIYSPEYLEYRNTYFYEMGNKVVPIITENGDFTGEVEKRTVFVVKNAYKEVTDKWLDKDWVDIQNDPAKKEFYDFYMEIMEQAISKIPTGAFDIKMIPSVFKKMNEILVDSPNKMQVLGSMVQNYFKPNATGKVGYYDSEAGMMEQQLPIYYTSKLQDEALVSELKNRLSKLDPETDKALYDSLNGRLKMLEGRRKVSDVSSDYFNILEQFATMAENYQNLQAIEGTMMMIKDVVENRNIYETDNQGNLLFEDEGKTIPRIKPGQTSRAARRFTDYVNAVYYEEPLDEGTIGKLADQFTKYTSLRGLGLNFFSGVNNLVMGGIQQNIEAVGGLFYNKEQYLQATKELSGFMFNDLFKHLGNEKALYTGKHSTKMMAFLELFDILQDQSELSGRGEGGSKRFLKQALGMNWAFATLNAGEFFNQSRLGISVALNSELTNSITGETSNVWDALELVDGKLKFKEGFEMSLDAIGELSNKIRGINQYIHGRYTKEDASRLQRYWLGKLAFQFRKWMAPAIEQRFRSRYYDERIGMYLEGRYNSLWSLINTLQENNWKVMESWNKMDELQKGNMRKNMMEFAYFIGAIGVGTILAGIAEGIDDDDEILKKTVNFLAYQDSRLITELSQFANPMEFYNMVKNPIAGVDVIKQGTEFLFQLAKLPVNIVSGDTEKLYFESGQNKERLRLSKEGLDLLPMGVQINKWMSLSEGNKEYYIK